MLFFSPSGKAALPHHSLRSKVIYGVLLATSIYTLSTPLCRWADDVWQTSPLSTQHELGQTFFPSPLELACLYGDVPFLLDQPADDFNESLVPAPIPNAVHYVRVVRNGADLAEAEALLGFVDYLAVRSVLVALQPADVFLHFAFIDAGPSDEFNAKLWGGHWLSRLLNVARPDGQAGGVLKLVYHGPEELHQPPYTLPSSSSSSSPWSTTTAAKGVNAERVAAVMPLAILAEQGGIYMDVYTIALRSFEPLRYSVPDTVLGSVGGDRRGLGTGIVAARPGSAFVAQWLDSYRKGTGHQHLPGTSDRPDGASTTTRTTATGSGLLPPALQLGVPVAPDGVCPLAPNAFYWPASTPRHIAWMHDPLASTEAAVWASQIERNEGALFAHQAAYYPWATAAREGRAWDRYLRHLTPHAVRNKDTRFNFLVRRFMEDDVR